VSLSGIARAPESAGSFTPAPDRARRIEWVRDPVRLAALVDTGGRPVAPFTLDLPAGGPTGFPDGLPQGGETVMEFPNHHLGYAFTWFGFALLTPLLLAYWIWRQRAARRA
jgi:surfeit locus 1 family protein